MGNITWIVQNENNALLLYYTILLNNRESMKIFCNSAGKLIWYMRG